MTYILGARCKNGVVLVADTKSVNERTNETTWTYDKITKVSQSFILSASGYSDFRNSLMRHANVFDHPDSLTTNQILITLERSYEEMVKVYGEKFRTELSLLVGTRQEGVVELNVIDFLGSPSPVKTYRALGSGGAYGEFFFREFWNDNFTVEETAALAYFVLRYIEQYSLDIYTGIMGTGEPNIWFMKDGNNGLTVRGLLTDGMKTYAEDKLKKIDRLIDDWSKP